MFGPSLWCSLQMGIFRIELGAGKLCQASSFHSLHRLYWRISNCNIGNIKQRITLLSESMGLWFSLPIIDPTFATIGSDLIIIIFNLDETEIHWNLSRFESVKPLWLAACEGSMTAVCLPLCLMSYWVTLRVETWRVARRDIWQI